MYKKVTVVVDAGVGREIQEETERSKRRQRDPRVEGDSNYQRETTSRKTESNRYLCSY